MKAIFRFLNNQIFNTIRSAIVYPVSVFFTVSIVIIAIFILGGSQVAIDNSVEQLHQATIDQIIHEIVYEIKDAENLASQHTLMLQNNIIQFDDPSMREPYFVASLKNHPQVIMTYIGYPDKRFYGARRDENDNYYVVKNDASTGGNSNYFYVDRFGEATSLYERIENYDLTTRPWYIAAVKLKQTNISQPYSHFVFKLPTITVSVPIYDQHNDLIAVFGVDLLITGIKDLITALKIGEHSEVVITNPQNQIIATTTGDPEFTMVNDLSVVSLLSDSENAIMKATYEINTKFENDEVNKLKINGVNYSVSSKAYTDFGLDWRIYTFLTDSDFNTKARKTVTITALITALSLLLFITFFNYITKMIISPIQKLNTATQQLEEGQFIQIHESESKNEIATLTHSFNMMGAQITDLVKNLEEQVLERTKELEQKNQMLNDLSYRDALTNLPNRRKLFEFADIVFKTSSRTNQPIALLMLDIDWFKDYNDKYGHIEGDRCLTEIGEQLYSCVRRETDLCARYGGEEFVVIIQVPELEMAFQMAECIRSSIEAMSIEHSLSPYSVVTVSVGLYFGTIEPHVRLEQVISKADIALYQSKSKGRNQISIYREEDESGPNKNT